MAHSQAQAKSADVVMGVARRKTQKVSHLLAMDLRRQILDGVLPADQQLPSEAELSASLEISRDTLREALRILESQQLLEMRRGRGGGAVVRRPGLDAVARYVGLLLQLRKTTLAHLEEVRSVTEPAAAELVARRAEQADLDELIRLHDAERKVAGDPVAFVAAMSTFDQAVTELSGNQTLAVITGVFRDIYAGQVYSAIDGDDDVSADQIARRVIVSHSAFLDAARRGDAQLANATWSDYLYTTGRMMVNRSISRRPIDITALWRAQARGGSSDPTPRLAAQIAAEIRSRIAEGTLGEGDRLPPLPELADDFQVSRPTLREALRILEMEFLLDLRTGDRNGATIRLPSTPVAAQLSGTVLAARQTTVIDCFRALRMIEPPIAGLVAARISGKQLSTLRAIEPELARSVSDTPRFVGVWREAQELTFSAAKNPALIVITEILHNIRIGLEHAITPDLVDSRAVHNGNRKVLRLFDQFIAAAAEHDSTAARNTWTKCSKLPETWTEESAFGALLMRDLLD